MFIIKRWGSLNKFPDFFSYGHFYWLYTHETLVPFEVVSSSYNALDVPFQQLLEGSMEVLLFERVNALCPLIGQCVAESLGGGIDSREKIDLWLLQKPLKMLKKSQEALVAFLKQHLILFSMQM